MRNDASRTLMTSGSLLYLPAVAHDRRKLSRVCLEPLAMAFLGRTTDSVSYSVWLRYLGHSPKVVTATTPSRSGLQSNWPQTPTHPHGGYMRHGGEDKRNICNGSALGLGSSSSRSQEGSQIVTSQHWTLKHSALLRAITETKMRPRGCM